MGTNCAPLVADLFLYTYEKEFIQNLQKQRKNDDVKCFIGTSRYLDDILAIDNPVFEKYKNVIYPQELILRGYEREQIKRKPYRCRFSYFLESAVILASALTILVIGVDRYFAICKSTTDNARKRLSVARKIIGIWTLASLSSVPCAFIVNLQGGIYNEGTTSETCYLILDRKWKFAYFISMLVVLFFLIFLVLLFLIQRMSSFLLPESNLFEGQIQAKRIRERRRVVFMLFLVVICFFACVLPVRLLMISFVLDEGKTITRLGIEAFANLNISLRMLMYLNSALNPVIYNLSTNIRKVTVSLLRKWCILCKKQQRYGVDNQEAEMNHRNPEIPARQGEFNLGQISIIPYNKQ
ncbi:hypothetical protein FSP39_022034 [Pinctada imbricata]|uniref:G-protein coupled receptors family 1 profile domain-containing protein n=1 Tax=Pinctada imbricata TaxID=66713 RepID=A0AA88XJ81_PINIB|nr:hypothetical protein FSP39_022034 [Pinctada imbricata]